MKITMIGTGYVGLVSGACFADFGYTVTCVDKDREKIALLQKGKIPIYEPGLDTLVAKGIAKKNLSFTDNIEDGIREADVIFLAVGTPSRRGDGHADLSFVFKAVEEIAHGLPEKGSQGPVIVTKSTVPVGTGRQIQDRLRSLRPDLTLEVASNPEFLREGSALEDFMKPDRVVVGTSGPRSYALLKDLYRPLYLLKTPMVMTTLETAELIKYAANGFLATKIAFINEMADLCEATGAQIQDLAQGLGADNRIGQKFLHVGPGYGGSCFPKDTLALAKTARDVNAPSSIIEAVIGANQARKEKLTQRIIDLLQGVSGKTIGVLGVTFKPNTDDMRDSASLTIVPGLQKAGAHIQAYDPVGMEEAQKFLPQIQWCSTSYEVAQNADAIVILTEWTEFRRLDLNKLGSVMKQPILIDYRNIYTPEEMEETIFAYHSLGRVCVNQKRVNNHKGSEKEET